jgi:hypothetical protein
MKNNSSSYFIAFTFSSCEKDDICDATYYPRLVIQFYDVNNASVAKNTNLTIMEKDKQQEFPLMATR